MPGPIRTSAPCSPRIPFGRLSPDLIAEDLSEVTYLAEQLLALAGTVTCLLKSSALLPPSSLPPTEGGTVADTLKGFDAIGRQFVDRLARKAAAFAEVATGEPVSGIHAPTAHHAVQEYARQFRDQLDALLAVVSGRLAESLAGFPAEQFRDHWPAIVEHCRRVPAYLDRFADDTSALRAATEREAFNASRRRGMTPPGPADTAASSPPTPEAEECARLEPEDRFIVNALAELGAFGEGLRQSLRKIVAKFDSKADPDGYKKRARRLVVARILGSQEKGGQSSGYWLTPKGKRFAAIVAEEDARIATRTG